MEIQEVTKVVEKVVKETVIVEGTPQVVEKVVKETVIVKEEVKPTAAPTGPQKVLYGTWGDENFLKPIKAQIEEFNGMQSDYIVELQPVVGAAMTHYLTVFAAGVGPDCFFILDLNGREFVTKGVAAALDGYLDKVGGTRDRWFPELLKPYIMKGQLWGMPQGWGADSINHFNADLLAKAGIESPIETDKAGGYTWEVFRQQAKELTTRDADGNPTQFGFEWDGDWSKYYPAMLAYGGSFFDDKMAKFTANEPEAIEGIQMWADIRNVDESVPIPVPGQTTPTNLTFAGGGVGMKQVGFWHIGMLLNMELPFKWDISLPPSGSVGKGCTGGSGGILVHTLSKVQEGAFAFAWHRNQEAAQMEQLASVADMSAVKSINPKLPEANPAKINWAAAVDIVDSFTQRPYRVGLVEIFSKYIQPALDEVTQGIKTAEEAMNGIAATVDEELAKLTDEV